MFPVKALILSNGQFKEQEIKNTLEELQSIVGGYIEFPFISKVFRDNVIDVIINEEGKYIEGLKAEIAVVDGKTKQVLDVIFGNCVFASHDEEGNTIELNDKQMKIIMQELQMDMNITYPNGAEFKVKALFV